MLQQSFLCSPFIPQHLRQMKWLWLASQEKQIIHIRVCHLQGSVVALREVCVCECLTHWHLLKTLLCIS